MCNSAWVPARPRSSLEHGIFGPDYQALVPGTYGSGFLHAGQWLAVHDRGEQRGLKTLVQRLSGIDLNRALAVRRACIGMPIAFGLLSVMLGLDTNWDVYNYHLYNPFAWLNGKLAIDLAPAGFQSYFNPLLDLPYYWMQKFLSAPLAGFAMGWLHGLNFVLLFGIARAVCIDLPEADRNRVPLLLALAGCLTANFLASIGNTMGDNATALFVLGALLVVLRHWDRLCAPAGGSSIVAIAAGVLAGLGAGLKLTNAIYAAALGAALLGCPLPWPQRLRLALVFTLGGVLGLAITGGHWMWTMFTVFGNPLFPQFGILFPNPLASSVGVADAAWGPKSTFETLLWPFVFSLQPLRVGHLVLHQVIWPIVYVLGGWWLFTMIRARLLRADTKAAVRLDPRVRFLLLFAALGYLLWMGLFGIARYLVPLEILAPLLAFVLLRQLLPYAAARRAAAYVIAAATAVVLAGGVRTWGHEGWTQTAFRADVPAIADPARTTAVVLATDPPWAWLATLFPVDVAFIGVGGEVLNTPAYAQRVRRIVDTRSGPVFAIAPAHYNWREDNIAMANAWAALLGLTNGEQRCAGLRRIVEGLRLRALVVDASSRDGLAGCRLGALPADIKDVPTADRSLAEGAAAAFARHGVPVDVASCSRHLAHAGKRRVAYQWCRVTPPWARSLELLP